MSKRKERSAARKQEFLQRKRVQHYASCRLHSILLKCFRFIRLQRKWVVKRQVYEWLARNSPVAESATRPASDSEPRGANKRAKTASSEDGARKVAAPRRDGLDAAAPIFRPAHRGGGGGGTPAASNNMDAEWAATVEGDAAQAPQPIPP